MKRSSSVSSERKSSPCFTYGPNRPRPATTGVAALGMRAELARQLQQPQRFVQRDRRLGHAAEERRPLRLLLRSLLRRFAELHVGAEAAVDGVDVLARRGVGAEQRGPFGLGANQRHRLLDGEVRRRQYSAAATPCCRGRLRPAAGTGRSGRCARESARRTPGRRRRRSAGSRRVSSACLAASSSPRWCSSPR